MRARGRSVFNMLAICAGMVCAATASQAQSEQAAEPELSAEPGVEEGDASFAPEDLDTLVAPIALFPDALLAQILVASTFPLDLVKAARFVAQSGDLPEGDRSSAAEAEGWDPSVAVLAAGFPSVVTRMADELDWTEQLGDAMVLQTDDVLDAVQRMRARAAATGYLDSNEAQVVEEDAGTISIEPADPDVVYVPSYDPAMAYVSAPTAPATIVQDDGFSTGQVVATGAMAFGAALLIGEIFDDDDDDWNNYWRPGPPRVDWDNDSIHARPGRNVDIDGDVNIDVDRGRIGSVDRDRIDVDRGDDAWKPSAERRNDARANLQKRERPATAGASGDQGAMRDKIAARGDGGGALARSGAGSGGAVRRPEIRDSALAPKKSGAPEVRKAAQRGAKSASHAGAGKAVKTSHKKISKPKQAKSPARHTPAKASALKKKPGGAKRAKASSNRGKQSKGRRHGR